MEEKSEVKPEEQLRRVVHGGGTSAPRWDLVGQAGGEAFPKQAFDILDGWEGGRGQEVMEPPLLFI